MIAFSADMEHVMNILNLHLRLKHVLDEFKSLPRLKILILWNKLAFNYEMYVKHVVHQAEQQVYLLNNYQQHVTRSFLHLI